MLKREADQAFLPARPKNTDDKVEGSLVIPFNGERNNIKNEDMVVDNLFLRRVLESSEAVLAITFLYVCPLPLITNC